jgi:16S rRNA (cytosine1402-N4)-methyltransferase
VASFIVRAREKGKLTTMKEFVDLLKPLAPHRSQNRFYARVFQALRMEVNEELAALKALLHQAASLIRSGGRLVVISYHSLEDRYVKNCT